MALSLEEASKLVAGDRVVYLVDTRHEAHGVVTEVGPRFIGIAWDDGMPGAVHPEDMANYTLERWPGSKWAGEK